jgi:hypothetical protein
MNPPSRIVTPSVVPTTSATQRGTGEKAETVTDPAGLEGIVEIDCRRPAAD